MSLNTGKIINSEIRSDTKGDRYLFKMHSKGTCPLLESMKYFLTVFR